MNKISKIALCLCISALSLGVGMGSFAHSGMSGPVGERMQDMLDLGKGLRSLTQEMRGENRQGPLIDAAEIIRENAALISTKFEQNITTAPSEALPQIWSDWADFDARAIALEATAHELIAAIRAQDGEQVQELSKSIRAQCSACHDIYRAP